MRVHIVGQFGRTLGLLVFITLLGIASPLQLLAGEKSKESGLPGLEERVAVLEAELARIPGLEQRVAALEAELVSIKEVLAYMSVVPDELNGLVGPHLIIEGCNVHVRGGPGYTADVEPPSGLGNLVVGYNEKPSSDDCERTGSHNLIIGPQHCFSGVGGLVAGVRNTISGNFAGVLGGAGNTASGWYSTVTAGYDNTASGFCSSVSGGLSNKASGYTSSVTGGEGNEATGQSSSVTGGEENLAEKISSSVTGGVSNWAAGDVSTVSGGFDNKATGQWSTVSGGSDNEATGWWSTVSGGQGLNAGAAYEHLP